MELFQTSVLSFEKNAGEVTLPDEPVEWQPEILQEVYKQCPFVGNFDVQLDLSRVDAERGYGYGAVILRTKTALLPHAPREEQEKAGVKIARIPIVIQDKKLQPFDLLLSGSEEGSPKLMPLTENRLRQALFRPQVFDTAAKLPGDQSLLSQLYPPLRNGGGMGGTSYSYPVADSQKMASSSLLNALVPQLQREQYLWFVQKTAALSPYLSNDSTRKAWAPALRGFMDYQYEDMETKVASSLEPSVALLRRLGENTYLYKAANHRSWKVEEVELTRGQALEHFGSKTVLAADMSGGALMGEEGGSDEEGVSSNPTEEVPETKPSTVTVPGTYKVQAQDGVWKTGVVLPHLIDFDGIVLPIALFTNSSETSLQPSIDGVPLSGAAPLPLMEKPVTGTGSFVSPGEGASVLATVPLTIQGSSTPSDDGVTVYYGTSYDGRKLQVHVVPGLKKPMLDGDTCLMPAHYLWLPLGQTKTTTLMSEEASEVKKAEHTHSRELRVFSTGSTFTIDGSPVEKLAGDAHFMDVADSLFLLRGFGFTTKEASDILARAYGEGGTVKVAAKRMIVPQSEALEEVRQVKTAMKKIASGVFARTGLEAVDLLKEAAALQDPMAVDTVLSLGFLNAENSMTFVSYLPQLEMTQSKLCELLFSARIGQKNLPVPALERCIRSLETVIEGLKVLSFNELP